MFVIIVFLAPNTGFTLSKIRFDFDRIMKSPTGEKKVKKKVFFGYNFFTIFPIYGIIIIYKNMPYGLCENPSFTGPLFSQKTGQ